METLEALHTVSAVGAFLVSSLWVSWKLWRAGFKAIDLLKERSKK